MAEQRRHNFSIFSGALIDVGINRWGLILGQINQRDVPLSSRLPGFPSSQLHFSMDTLDLVAGSRSQPIAVVKLSIIVNYTRHVVVRNLHCWDFTTIVGWIKQPDVFNLSHRFSATQILEVHLRQKVRLKDGKARAALGKYEEGLYIVDKCREVWLFRRADGRSQKWGWIHQRWRFNQQE